MRKADTDGDGFLSTEEFEAFTWDLRRMEVDEELEVDFVFSVFDTRGAGTLDFSGFKQLLNFHSGGDSIATQDSYVAWVMSEIDRDRDGEVTVEEYRRWWVAAAGTTGAAGVGAPRSGRSRDQGIRPATVAAKRSPSPHVALMAAALAQGARQ